MKIFVSSIEIDISLTSLKSALYLHRYFFYYLSNQCHDIHLQLDRFVRKGIEAEYFLIFIDRLSRSYFSHWPLFPFHAISARYLFNPPRASSPPPLFFLSPTTFVTVSFPFRVDNRLVRVNASVEWQQPRGGVSLKLIMKLNATTA